MSNFLAIATVTATLKKLLQEATLNDVQGSNVTTIRPDGVPLTLLEPQVNVYLYQVTPNAAWRNADLPTRRPDGSVLQRPQVALDLHYMISFYGDESQLHSQRLLGSVARTLYTQPILTREMIRSVITAPASARSSGTSDSFPYLSESNLADQVDLVRFSPLHLSLEEMSKIWSVFFQIPYALSVAYQGSVVLIESDDTPQSSLPVQVRNIYAVPFRQPVIERILAQSTTRAPNQATTLPDKPITIDDTLLILGKRLQGSNGTFIQMNGIEPALSPGSVSDTQITLDLKTPLPGPGNSTLADSLRAGIQGLQVLQLRQMGIDAPTMPQNWHRGVSSNIAAFVLRPSIRNIVLAPGAGSISVTVAPPISRQQRVMLLLNAVNVPSTQPSAAYSFIAKQADQAWTDKQGTDVKNSAVKDPTLLSSEDTASTINFSLPALKPGTYFVRIQVDGAESVLEVDTSTPHSSTFGTYQGKQSVAQVEITGL
jgi:hypothetical protein